MEFSYGYQGSSSVESRPDRTAMQFSPDLNRSPTFFRGELSQGVAFREAISALHDVVVSDLRYKPKDRSEYLAWLERQELVDFAGLALKRRRPGLALEAFQRAFEREPALARDWSKGHRYDAACAAAIAGMGDGDDAKTLDEVTRSAFRARGIV